MKVPGVCARKKKIRGPSGDDKLTVDEPNVMTSLVRRHIIIKTVGLVELQTHGCGKTSTLVVK